MREPTVEEAEAAGMPVAELKSWRKGHRSGMWRGFGLGLQVGWLLYALLHWGQS